MITGINPGLRIPDSLRLLRTGAEVRVGLVRRDALLFVRSMAPRHPIGPRRRGGRNERHVRRLMTKLENPLDHHALEHVVEPPEVAENPSARVGLGGGLRPMPAGRLARDDLIADSVLEGVV